MKSSDKKKKMKDTKEIVEKLKETLSEEFKKVIKKGIKKELEIVIEEKVKKDLEEIKRYELEDLEDMNSVLIVKERQSNDEIQEAHKELIKGLRDLECCQDSCKIGVKRIGEVDAKPFMKACEQRFTGEEAMLQHAMLCSKWQQNINNPTWQPFKHVETGNKMKEVVDEEDKRLRKLRKKWGKEVMNAVKTSLEELNEFNPSGRYIVSVAWNFEKGRKATLKEGFAHMTKHINTLKHKHT